MKSSLTASRVQPWKVNRGRHLLIAPGTLAAEAGCRVRYTFASKLDVPEFHLLHHWALGFNVVAVSIWAFVPVVRAGRRST